MNHHHSQPSDCPDSPHASLNEGADRSHQSARDQASLEKITCPHQDQCPGCPLLGLPYSEQLELKEGAVRDALAPYNFIEPPRVARCAGTPDRTGYRTRVKWVVDGLKVGLYGRGHQVVHIPGCVVAPGGVVRLARHIAACAQTVAAAEEKGAGGSGSPGPRGGRGGTRLAGLDLRHTARGEVTGVLIMEGPNRGAAKAMALKIGVGVSAGPVPEQGGEGQGESEGASPVNLTGLAWSWRPPKAHTTLGGTPEEMLGQCTVEDRIGLVPAYFPPGSFSQAHRGQTAALQEHLARLLTAASPGNKVCLYDLYGGTGSLGFSLAHLARRMVIVESYGPSAEGAEKMAARLNLTNVQVVHGDAAEVLADLAKSRTSGSRQAGARVHPGGSGRPGGGRQEGSNPMVLLLDPPRTGLSGRAIKGVIASSPQYVLYVSCHPLTMARDLSYLANHGLVVEGPVTPIDMMPGTNSVEVVALLRRTTAPRLHHSWFHMAAGEGADGRLLVVDKPPFMPTVPHPEWPASAGETVTANYPGYHPANRLDQGTSGLVLFFNPGQWTGPHPLTGSRKFYRALAKGITRKKGSINRPLGEKGALKQATTKYRRLAVVGGHSYLEIELITGRTHQIRRHLSMIGHPVLGDTSYGHRKSNLFMEHTWGLTRPFLHAAGLTLRDGTHLESPLPGDLQQVLNSMEP